MVNAPSFQQPVGDRDNVFCYLAGLHLKVGAASFPMNRGR